MRGGWKEGESERGKGRWERWEVSEPPAEGAHDSQVIIHPRER